MDIWYIFQILVSCTKTNLATLIDGMEKKSLAASDIWRQVCFTRLDFNCPAFTAQTISALRAAYVQRGLIDFLIEPN
jgi:hypothetical protein